MNISNAVIEEIRDRIYDKLVTYQQDMDLAYNLCGDALGVRLGVKIAPDKGAKKVTIAFNFIKDQCQDTSSFWVDDEQGYLFNEEGGAE